MMIIVIVLMVDVVLSGQIEIRFRLNTKIH